MDGTVIFTGVDDHTRQSIEVLVAAMGFTTRSDVDVLNPEELKPIDQPFCIVLNSGFLDLEKALAQAKTILRAWPPARLILLCSDCATREVVNAMRVGLSSVLEYPFSYEELEQALQLAIQESLASRQETKSRIALEVAELLTKQEQEIAQMLLDGAGTKQISVKLDLNIRTIHYRKKALFRKLGSNGRSSAIELLSGSSRITPRSMDSEGDGDALN